MQEYIHCFYLCIKSSINFIYSFRILLTVKLFITPFFDYIYHSKCLYPFICLYLHQSYFRYFTSMSIADWLLGRASPSLVQCAYIRREYRLKWKLSLEGCPNLQSGVVTRKRCSSRGLTQRASQKTQSSFFLSPQYVIRWRFRKISAPNHRL